MTERQCPNCGSFNTYIDTWNYAHLSARVFICSDCGLNEYADK